MSRFILTLICAALTAWYALPAFSADVVRYDFKQKLGEGDVAIYRLELDRSAGSGRFCFAESSGAGIDMAVRDRIYSGEPWPRLVDISKIEHACAIVYTYGLYGRFYTQRMIYGAVKREYVFVFAGDFEGGKMNGEMYVFIDLPSGKGRDVIRTFDKFDVNATGTRVSAIGSPGMSAPKAK